MSLRDQIHYTILVIKFVSILGKNTANHAVDPLTVSKALKSNENLDFRSIVYPTIMQTNDQGHIVESLESPNRLNINGSIVITGNSTGM